MVQYDLILRMTPFQSAATVSGLATNMLQCPFVSLTRILKRELLYFRVRGPFFSLSCIVPGAGTISGEITQVLDGRCVIESRLLEEFSTL